MLSGQIRWQYVEKLDAVNEAIGNRDAENWPGLYAADQIISVTWNQSIGVYVIVWREWV